MKFALCLPQKVDLRRLVTFLHNHDSFYELAHALYSTIINTRSVDVVEQGEVSPEAAAARPARPRARASVGERPACTPKMRTLCPVECSDPLSIENRKLCTVIADVKLGGVTRFSH